MQLCVGDFICIFFRPVFIVFFPPPKIGKMSLDHAVGNEAVCIMARLHVCQWRSVDLGKTLNFHLGGRTGCSGLLGASCSLSIAC